MNSVSTPHAPAAIGPYSQAVIAGNLVFCSGQIALDPHSGTLLDGDVAAQTRLVLSNLRAVLEAAGSGLPHVIKTTVFLADMNDFQAMNEIYAEVFGDHRPARAAVEVSRLPRDVAVEIDAIAEVP